jgi:tRNA(His) guanylyltransferase
MILEIDNKIKEINNFVEGKSLGERMKEYENLTRFHLSKDFPMIIRLDGNAFHTFTRGFEKPFDSILRSSMEETAKYLVENIPGAQMAYHQSDEISILVTNYNISNREPWFGNNTNKIVSITAAMATLSFNRIFSKKVSDCKEANLYHESRKRSAESGAIFDSRVFILPKDEVVNYFIWRQQDAIKNSVSMVAQSLFSHNSLQGMNGSQMIERIFHELGIVYDQKYTITERRGSVVHRLKVTQYEKTINLSGGKTKVIKYERVEWDTDPYIPIFKDNREYIERFL